MIGRYSLLWYYVNKLTFTTVWVWVTYILWVNQSQGKSAGGVSLLPPKRDRTLYRDIERKNTYRERNYMDRDIVTKHTNRIYVGTYSMYVLTILLAI